MATGSLLALISCGALSQPPPPVTAEVVRLPGKSPESKRHRLTMSQLNEGRTLFVSRCIECHTLPPVWHYTNAEWPRLVDSMADRANLKPGERDAIVGYILAARAR